MDLFMRRIPLAASEDDVKVELARILHKPPFPLEPQLNFDLYFFKKFDTRGKVGILTLPTVSAGNTFLHAYGVTGVPVKGARIFFTRSNKPINQERLAILNATTWRDPRALQAEKERRIQEGRPYTLTSYGFGRFLPDGSFSSECVAEGEAEIACDLERRHVRFTLRKQSQRSYPDDDVFSMLGMLHLDLQYDSIISASYLSSAIDSIVDSRVPDRPTLFIRANAFPIFATEVSSLDRQESRRSQGLIPDTPMPSGCFSLACTFAKEQDKDAFIYACRTRFRIRHHSKEADIVIHEREFVTPPNLDFLGDLPFELAFEVEKSVTNWTLSPFDVHSLKGALEDLCESHGDAAAPIFQKFSSLLEDESAGRKSGRKRASRRRDCPAPATLLDRLIHAIDVYLEEQQRPRGRLTITPGVTGAGVSYTYHLILTPTRHILEGPVIDQSNSVLRRFGHHECFLRVSFQDENRSKLRRDLDTSITDLLAKRYRPVLLNGCIVAGRRYHMLGYSMSGLKEHSLWFVTPFLDDEGGLLDAQTIRQSLGDFSRLQHQPARLGARWSQAFSATDPSITIQLDEIRYIPDLKSTLGSDMTDGCSPISRELAGEIWRANQRTKKRPARGKIPSAFQFRLGGAKGMVVQDNTLEGRVVCLRPSQVKFEAPNNRTFDIQSTSTRPKAMFLNRPLIVVMEYLGVSVDRVIELQDRSISEAQSIRSSFKDASKVLQQHGLGTSFHLPSLFRNMSTILSLKIGDETNDDTYLYNDLVAKSLHCAETHMLRELKYRAHIAVPGSFTLLGVSDEWDCLGENEIYATVQDEKTGLYQEITGKVAITRSPQIHPGDVQVVTAVRRPELEHLTNVVVFSCRGDRALSSCLGGGDLDGDDFNLILDPEILPQRVATPGEYISLPIKTTPHPCGIEDVVDFIFNYIEADLVGHIAISHLRFSDLADPSCKECLDLAQLASHAVDFPKTGTPVRFQDLPKHRTRTKPDFLAREGADIESDQYYNSEKLLGQLFRRVPVNDWMPDEWNGSQSPSGGNIIERALTRVGLYGLGLSLATPSEELHEEMWYLLEEYGQQLLAIGTTHTISKNKDTHVSEAELVSGTIIANWSDHHKRREAVGAMNLQTHELVRSVRAEMRASNAASREQEEDELSDDGEWDDDEDDYYRESRLIAESFKRAWAAWCVAEEELQQEPQSYGSQSFGLIALGKMLELIKAAKLLV
ncbi:RdRP-domain-containing protein [Paxillus ammoniavirescens]|nr:RdRP-domain-containing protein [Paxillus ammoniavirescens]